MNTTIHRLTAAAAATAVIVVVAACGADPGATIGGPVQPQPTAEGHQPGDNVTPPDFMP